MSLESATYISDLVATNPTSGDAKNQGDDHLRLLKSTVKATFPNVSGAVTPTHTELNFVDGVTSAIQTQIDTKAPSISPSFTTPALGTPSSGVMTNVTGTAAGLTAGNVTTNANLTGHITSVGNAALLGSFTSAQLATALTDETGSGANVFANSPTLVTPALGTPASGVMTNVTGTASGLTAGNVTTNANLTGHITSIGNAAVLGSFSSAQLATALTDETGSGAAVFAVSPTFTGTPAAPTATLGTNTTQLATTAFVQAAGFASSFTGTLAQLNAAITDADVASLAGSEVLTNKTLALGSNTVSGTTAQFNTALTDGDFATLAGSEVLTNKTIALGSNTVSGTIAQFNTAVTDADLAILVSNTFTGAQNFARATVESHATTADIWAALGNQIDWTGTATTTAFPAAPQAGAERVLICAGACSFTAGANMLIDGVASAATVTCAANDTVIVRAVSTTQFKLTRVKYDGTAQVSATGTGTGTLIDVTASRALATNYTNVGTTTRWVTVVGNVASGAGQIQLYSTVGGIFSSFSALARNATFLQLQCLTFPVPAGVVYKVDSGGTLQQWYEYQ